MPSIGVEGRAMARLLGIRYVLVVASIAAVYILAGRLGLLLAHFHQNATLIWAPTGLSLAALVLYGARVWPGVFLGAAITNAWIGAPPVAILAIAVGNTLEAVVGATLLERVARFDPAFARLRDVIGFLIYGALLSSTVSASIGVGALYFAGTVEPASFGTVWLIWWLGDVGGAIVVAPLLLVGFRGRPPWRALARRPTLWISLALLVVLMSLEFGGTSLNAMQSLLPAFLVFPVLVWAGLRLGPRGAILGSFLTGIAAVIGTAQGVGPFGNAGQHSLVLVWAYISTVGAVAMILAAAVAEREDADLCRQRGEQERARLSAQVQHAQRLESLGMLAGGVAHDFNNLLVAIRGNAELLKLEARFDARQRETMLDEIEAASVHAANLCRQLLTYAGHYRIDKQRVDLLTIIEETLPLLRRSIARSIELRVAGAHTVIEGDRTQLGQVLMNLVLNAAESIEDASGWVHVSLSSRELDRCYLEETFLHSDAPAGCYAVLEVSDSGRGMSAETLERIFDPFFTTKKTGRGLGMAVVLGIVSAHGGAIKVRSRPMQGTTFEILFPIAPALEQPAQLELPVTRACHPVGTVLLAEDEERVRRTTRLLLESAGFGVLEACDGAAAVELFEREADQVDVVLLDVSMPGLNGPDALAQIHALRPEVPAVLMSGYDEGRVDPSSGTLFVQKPFKMSVLLETISDARQRQAAPHKRRSTEP